MFSAYTILTKVISRDDTNDITLIRHCGWLLSFYYRFWITHPWSTCFPFLAALFGSLAHVFIITALHLAPASALQPFNYTMLIWSTFLWYLVFGDFLTNGSSGAAAIVISGLLAWHWERKGELRNQ